MAAGSQSESELKLAAAVRNEESEPESGRVAWERERCGCVIGARAFLRICFARLRRHSAESHTHTCALSTDTNTHTHTLAGIRIGIGMLTHFGGSDDCCCFCCCCCYASCQLREATVTRQLQTQAQALGSKIICNFWEILTFALLALTLCAACAVAATVASCFAASQEPSLWP